MPILALPLTVNAGVRVQAQVTLGRPEILRRRRALMPIPQPVSVVAAYSLAGALNGFD